MTQRQPRRVLLLGTLTSFAALATFVLVFGLLGFARSAPLAPAAFSSALERTAATVLEAGADVAVLAKPTGVAKARRYDAYKGWQNWCESRPTPCKAAADCTADKNGQARRCVRPWWSKTEKVCAIPYSGRKRREQLGAYVQQVVEAQCTGRCNAAELGKFVALIAMRESTMRPWKRHRLEGDVRLAKKNWTKAYKTLASVNPHYGSGPDRWDGLGLLGQQSVTFVPAWDRAAPPEILCRAPVAIATYLHCARRTHTKQSSLGITPTWETIHASCSGGKVRPKGPSENFRARARKLDLDPDQKVPIAWLGVSPGKSATDRNLTLGLIEAALARVEAKM